MQEVYSQVSASPLQGSRQSRPPGADSVATSSGFGQSIISGIIARLCCSGSEESGVRVLIRAPRTYVSHAIPLRDGSASSHHDITPYLQGVKDEGEGTEKCGLLEGKYIHTQQPSAPRKTVRIPSNDQPPPLAPGTIHLGAVPANCSYIGWRGQLHGIV